MTPPTQHKPTASSEFIGKASAIAAQLWRKIPKLKETKRPFRWLFSGPAGTGKSRLAEVLAVELAGHPVSITHLNGQSLKVEVVRDWTRNSAYRPLWGDYTIRWVDEIDGASDEAMTELRTYLDSLPPYSGFIATTNVPISGLQKQLQTRCVCYPFDKPTPNEITSLLTIKFGVELTAAAQIAIGCDGCVRAALIDAEEWLENNGRIAA
jgi:replication-associated recombination protein RarA